MSLGDCPQKNFATRSPVHFFQMPRNTDARPVFRPNPIAGYKAFQSNCFFSVKIAIRFIESAT